MNDWRRLPKFKRNPPRFGDAIFFFLGTSTSKEMMKIELGVPKGMSGWKKMVKRLRRRASDAQIDART